MVLIARQRPEAGVLSGSSMWMGVGQVLGASSAVFSLISRGWIRSEAAAILLRLDTGWCHKLAA